MKPREILPRSLGRYELVLPIATGGMGVVYLGRAIGAHGFQREVAIKVLRPDREQKLAADLLREAKIAGLIRHPNVVQVLDVGDEDGEIYLVMEFIDGDSLHGLSRAASSEGARIPLEVGLKIVLEGLAGLHRAHELRSPGGEPLGLVHRDFSPQNLLIGTDGITRLTDFGIAKIADADRHTTAGVVKGKFSYMSPEQARSESLDRRSDVWSAAVVTWEVIVGRPLFPAGNDASTLLQIVTSDPPDPREIVSDLPGALAEAVMCGLRRDSRQRCPTASAFAERLRDAMATSDLELASDSVVARTLVGYLGTELVERQAKLRQALSPSVTGPSPQASSAPLSATLSSESGAVPRGHEGRSPEAPLQDATITTSFSSEPGAARDVLNERSGDERSTWSPRRRLGFLGATLALASIAGTSLYLSSQRSARETNVEISRSLGSRASALALDAALASSIVPTAISSATNVTEPTPSDSSTELAKPPSTSVRTNAIGKPVPAKKPKCSAWERCR